MALYEIAGLVVDMEPVHPTLSSRAAPYQLRAPGRPADIVIRQPEGYIDRMQQANPSLGEDQCEYLRFGSCFYRSLLRFDGMMLHASAVALDGRAYLFTAHSGTGKSTHTAQWLKLFGERAAILNDDKPALRWIGGQLCACGTPFSGKTPLSQNRCVPVGGICLLERGSQNRIWRISPREAVAFLFDQTIHSLYQQDMERLLGVLQSVLEAAPLYRMQCTIGTDAARTAHQAMAGGHKC